MDDAALLDICRAEGAADARVIDTGKIPFDPKLRSYCAANACGSYGRNYACPPHVGEPDELIARAKSYRRALLFQTVGELEDSFDIEGINRAGQRHKEVCAAIFDRIVPQLGWHMVLTAGGCGKCKTCAAVTGEPCRFPDQAVSSLEAYCMNVSQLCGKCGMKYINGANTVTFFAMCLFD